MNNDLAQMSKSGGIYRTLALLSILSIKRRVNGNGKFVQKQRYISDTPQQQSTPPVRTHV